MNKGFRFWDAIYRGDPPNDQPQFVEIRAVDEDEARRLAEELLHVTRIERLNERETRHDDAQS